MSIQVTKEIEVFSYLKFSVINFIKKRVWRYLMGAGMITALLSLRKTPTSEFDFLLSFLLNSILLIFLGILTTILVSFFRARKFPFGPLTFSFLANGYMIKANETLYFQGSYENIDFDLDENGRLKMFFVHFPYLVQFCQNDFSSENAKMEFLNLLDKGDHGRSGQRRK